MKRTFIYTDNKSNKFWTIEIKGTELTVTYGKVGTDGQTSSKSFADVATCQKEVNKLITEKTKKGYVEEGKTVEPPQASKAEKVKPVVPASAGLSPELIPFRRGDKWGYCTPGKTIVIPCIYDDARPFAHGMAEVMRSTVISEAKGKTPAVEKREYNFIDAAGRELLPEPVLATWPATDGLAFFRRFDKTCGFVNAKGEIVADGFANGEPFSEGFAAVKQKDKWGYIDTSGKVVIPAKYGSAKPFSEGMACVGKDGQYGYVDTTGKLVVSCKYDEAARFCEGLAAVQNDESQWGFIDKTGKKAIPFKYDEAKDFSQGRAAVQNDDWKWGYIDTKGKTIIPFNYEEATSFVDSLAFVQEDEYADGQLITLDGKLLPEKRRYCGDFSEGLARTMSDNNTWGFVNTHNQLVIPFRYKSTADFENGLCYVTMIENKKECTGYIGADGTEYWENVAAPVKKATSDPKKPADIRCDNYGQYTGEIGAGEAEEKYHISEYICYPFLDTAEEQDTRIHKGNLHLNSLTVTDGFNLIVDGDLTVNDDIEWSEWGRGAFLFVTGNLVVRNLFLAGCPAVAVLGNLTAQNGIVGSQGDNGGELIVKGNTKAKLICCTTYFNMDYATRPEAVIIADARDFPFDVDVDEADPVAVAKAVVPACCPEEEGMIEVDALREMLSQGKKVLK